MKKISLQELRSIIKSVIKENSYSDGPYYSFEVAETYGDNVVDWLAGIAGYDDASGDYDAIDRLFSFDTVGDKLVASDRQTGQSYVYDDVNGIWDYE